MLTGKQLQARGFAVDSRTGIFVKILEEQSLVGTLCRTELHLLPDEEGWAAEIWNLDDAEPAGEECTGSVRIPRPVRSLVDLGRLLLALSDAPVEA